MTAILRGNSFKVLVKYFLKHSFHRFESWFMGSAVLLIFAGYTVNSIRSIVQDKFIVTANIYQEPVFFAVLFVCVFLSFLEIIHVSRDLDSRIFESYLYGPVDELLYAVSIFVSYSVVAFLSVFALPLVWMFILRIISGFTFLSGAAAQLFYGYMMVNLFLGIAMCIGAGVRKSKTATWYLLLLHLVLTGIILGNTVVAKYLVPMERTGTDVFSFFRNVFQYLYSASLYFSPYTLFFEMQRNYGQSRVFLFACWVIVIACQAVFLVLSRYLFKRSVA